MLHEETEESRNQNLQTEAEVGHRSVRIQRKVKGDRAGLTAEAADVLYHLLVMLKSRDVALTDVMDELDRRQAQSGLAEKAARKT